MARWVDHAIRLFAWRTGHRMVRWIGALVLLVVALRLRFALGLAYGANPAVVFYPAILLAFALFGWLQAAVLLVLFVAAGIWWFLPPGLHLQPIGWIVVGGCNIALLAALEGVVAALVAANERQRLLFREVQHRTANALQAASGSLWLARQRVDSDPAGAAALLDEAARRVEASAEVHRRLNDPSLFERGLGPILRDAVSSIIDTERVELTVQVDELALSLDQMSNIVLLVIEMANNARKHVFQRGLGGRFGIALRGLPDGRASLRVGDDGPGGFSTALAGTRDEGLGSRVIRDLVRQLGGSLHLVPGRGTELIVEFPLRDHQSRLNRR
jgi:two-component sensor histidine kinase